MLSTQKRFLCGSATMFCLSVYLTLQAVPLISILLTVVKVVFDHISFPYLIVAIVCSCLAFVLLDIWRKDPPDSQTALGAFLVYIVMNIIVVASRWARSKLLKDRWRIAESQRRVLAAVMEHAKCTAYARENNLQKLTTVNEFRRNHPLTVYRHYVPWIERVYRGEEKVLIPEPVDYVCMTSGTTSGKSKGFPKNTAYFVHRIKSLLMPYPAPVFKIPKSTNIKYILDFRFRSETSTIGCGLKKGAASCLFQEQQYKYIEHIPFIAKRITDLNVALYVNLVFALRERDIGMMTFPFGSHAYAFFRCLTQRWREACADIRAGRINHSVVIQADGVLDALNQALAPDPDRADELEKELSVGLQDIVPRIWPHASVVFSIFTGSFTVHRKLLERSYLGSVPTRCVPHIGSESVYGLNIWESMDRKEEFIFAHTSNFFEFVHEDHIDEDQPQTLLLHELEIGERYEIVVTTPEGLYRYRTNDVVAVTEYEGQIPTYTFAQRADDNLSVFAEKTPVCVASSVVEACFSRWPGIALVEYCLTESVNITAITGGTDLRYVLLAEMVGDDPTAEQIDEVDSELQSQAERYAHYRQAGQVETLAVIRINDGAFDRLRRYLLSRNSDASAVQLKAPRRATNEAHLRQLLDL